MIPYGLNPFGLEDKTLTYHFYQNGIEYDVVPVKTHKNRLYCWAEIPQKYREDYGLEWSTQYAATEAEWDALQKYYTKKMEELEPIVTSSGSIVYPEPYWAETGYLDSSGRQRQMWMVHGNQDFYRCTFINWAVPEYASVYIIDTSGSMTSPDYDSVKCSITEAISEYNCFEHSQTDSKMWMYNGTYASNIISQRLGSLAFENLSPREIYNNVNKKVNGIAKRSSSEAMITCLYCAIADIQKQVVMENPITSGHLKALNFVLCTDESIFTDDTLQDYGSVESKFPWFKSWQENATNKFPSTISEITKVNFAKAITDALKQMSHYYGVNMSWALTFDITQDSGSIGTTIPFINVPASSGSEEMKMTGSKYVPSAVWHMPSGFHIGYPHEMMCTIELVIPDGMYFQGSLLLVESDQYNDVSLMGDASHMNKFHYVNSRKACAFRFWGENVTLPTIGYFGGASGVYAWVKQNDESQFDMGSAFTVSQADCNLTEYAKITFTLTRVSTSVPVTLHLNNGGGAYSDLTTANWTTNVGDLVNPADLQSNRVVYMTTGEAIPEIPECAASEWTFKNWMASGVTEGYEGRTAEGYYHFPDGEKQLSSHLYDFGGSDLWAQWTKIPTVDPSLPEWEIYDIGYGKSHATFRGLDPQATPGGSDISLILGIKFVGVYNSITVPEGWNSSKNLTMRSDACQQQCNCQRENHSTDPCFRWVQLARYPMNPDGTRNEAGVSYYVVPQMSIYGKPVPFGGVALHTALNANFSNPLLGELVQVGWDDFKFDVTKDVGITIFPRGCGYNATLEVLRTWEWSGGSGWTQLSGRTLLTIHRGLSTISSSGVWSVFGDTGDVYEYYNKETSSIVRNTVTDPSRYSSYRTYYPMYKIVGSCKDHPWGIPSTYVNYGTESSPKWYPSTLPMTYYYRDNGKFHGYVEQWS